jgi:hypothetical protein
VRRAGIAIVTLVIALAGCAAPRFDLRARFATGEVREYRLVADATVRFSFGRAATSERSHLVATARIDVAATTGTGTTLLLTITPTTLTRDGKRATTPPPQQIRIGVDTDGRVTQVTGATDQTSLATADIEDLVPLIGPPLPSRRVHLGDRWSRAAALPGFSPSPAPAPSPTATPGTQAARLAALRIVEGYRCAIVAISTRRPVVRERTIGGSPLRLEGLEFASSEIAFAFREGFPASVASDSEAHLGIAGGAAPGGSVIIATKTSLMLLRRSLP